MASIFKRGGKTSKGHYTIQYTDENGKCRTKKGTKDKDATQQIANKIEADIALRKAGLIDPKAERVSHENLKDISVHLKDWEKDFHARDISPKQIKTALSRVKKIFELAGIRYLGDIRPSNVQEAMGRLKNQGKAHKTLNDILSVTKQFCKWSQRDGRISHHPIQHLKG